MADMRKQLSTPRRKPAAAPAEPDTGGGAEAHGRQESAVPTANEAQRRGASRMRRLRQDRGMETRQRLIAAALDIFGRLGFDGASTRRIADMAGTNIAAINYHFGSKEALHVAVAEHIVTRISALMGPALTATNSPETFASPMAARAGLARLIGTFVDTILGEREAEQWARFIVREQMQPTEAFEVIYLFIGGAHDLGTRLVATILGKNADSEEMRLRTFALMGQVLVFRVAQALVLRQMGWETIGDAERKKIKRIVIAQMKAILDAEAGAA